MLKKTIVLAIVVVILIESVSANRYRHFEDDYEDEEPYYPRRHYGGRHHVGYGGRHHGGYGGRHGGIHNYQYLPD